MAVAPCKMPVASHLWLDPALPFESLISHARPAGNLHQRHQQRPRLVPPVGARCAADLGLRAGGAGPFSSRRRRSARSDRPHVRAPLGRWKSPSKAAPPIQASQARGSGTTWRWHALRPGAWPSSRSSLCTCIDNPTGRRPCAKLRGTKRRCRPSQMHSRRCAAASGNNWLFACQPMTRTSRNLPPPSLNTSVRRSLRPPDFG